MFWEYIKMKFEIPEEYKNRSGIYSVTNIANGKRIIGQASDFESRFRHYKRMLSRGIYGNVHLQSAYNKYGTDNFKMELVNLCDKENLTEMETHFCKAFNTLDRNFGYNKKDPIEHGKYTEDAKKRMSRAQMGNKSALGHKLSAEAKKRMSNIKMGSKIHSEEFKKRMSERLIGVPLSKEHRKRISDGSKGKILSKEHIKNLSIALKGRVSPSLGKKLSLETLKKISKAKTGQKYTEETKRKMSECRSGEKNINYGKHFSKETRKKMSEAKIGYVPWNKGKKHTEETKGKLSAARRKRVISEETKRKTSQSLIKHYENKKLLINQQGV